MQTISLSELPLSNFEYSQPVYRITLLELYFLVHFVTQMRGLLTCMVIITLWRKIDWCTRKEQFIWPLSAKMAIFFDHRVQSGSSSHVDIAWHNEQPLLAVAMRGQQGEGGVVHVFNEEVSELYCVLSVSLFSQFHFPFFCSFIIFISIESSLNNKKYILFEYVLV